MARTHSKLSKAVKNQLAAIDSCTVVVAAVRTVTNEVRRRMQPVRARARAS